jgi:hypothetical protein
VLFFFFVYRLVSEIVVVEPCRTTGEVEMPKSTLANAAKFGRYYVLFTSASGKKNLSCRRMQPHSPHLHPLPFACPCFQAKCFCVLD